MRLITAFGSDLIEVGGADFLRRRHKQGYELLAFDAKASVLAVQTGLPFHTLSSFLTDSDIGEALQQAELCRWNWYAPGQEEFTVAGICWPQIDGDAMRWFWWDSMLSLKLAEAIKKVHVQRLLCIRHLCRRPGIRDARSDVLNVILKTRLPGITSEILPRPFLELGQWASLLRRTAKRAFDPMVASQDAPVRSRRCAKGGVALVIAMGELHRFRRLIHDLSKRYRGRFALAASSQVDALPGAKDIDNSIPFFSGPRWPVAHNAMAALTAWLPASIFSSHGSRFIRAYCKCVDSSVSQPWHGPLKDLSFHFAYFLKYRWPQLLDHALRVWVNLWSTLRPQIVLSSSVGDPVQDLALYAARTLGISTVAISHGGISAALASGSFADRVCYENELQKRQFERQGVDAKCLLPVNGVLDKDEYPVEALSAFSLTDRCRILVLTEVPLDVGFMGAALLASELEALKAVVNPPPALADRVQVAIKVHPGTTDLSMIFLAGKEVEKRLLPLQSELKSLLMETDLVVALNYSGTALVQALQYKKPVIQFLNGADPIFEHNGMPYHLFRDGVTVARTGRELWTTVEAFISRGEVAAEMRARAADYARKWLDQKRFSPLSDVLESIVAAREDRRSAFMATKMYSLEGQCVESRLRG
jgi:hypothetical protein